MKFSPMWPIWAEDICGPKAEATAAWKQYIDERDFCRWVALVGRPSAVILRVGDS